MQLTVDWYNCTSYDAGQTWDCEYDHTEYNSGTPDYWGGGGVFHTTGDCSIVAQYCDNNFQPDGGSSPYTDPRRVGRTDPTGDDIILPIPSCPASSGAPKESKAYCAGHVPNAAELVLIHAALERMRQIGDICADLAGIGDALLSHAPPTLRVYPQGSYKISGAAPRGGGSTGSNSWAVISEDLINDAYDSSTSFWHFDQGTQLWYRTTLQTVLAHELDHLNGPNNGHIGENGGPENRLLTANTRLCSDVDMGSGLVSPP
ncbi:MAG: hypothetical protein ABIQ55_06620 [Gemmatimonadaceae bacterium]